MITATSSPDRFGSLLRGLLKKNIPNSERTNLFNLPDITPEEFIKVMDIMLKRMIKNR